MSRTGDNTESVAKRVQLRIDSIIADYPKIEIRGALRARHGVEILHGASRARVIGTATQYLDKAPASNAGGWQGSPIGAQSIRS